MRRLWAIALFAVLALPFVSPFFSLSSSPDTNLPACCRRDGRHHCAMMAMMEEASHETSVRQRPAACPYRTHSLLLARTFGFCPRASLYYYSAVVRHPAVHTQVVLQRLVSEARSHLKRGPPSFSAC